MTDERRADWDRLAPLLDRLFDAPPSERRALAAVLAGDDAQLRLSLDQVLTAAESDDAWIDRGLDVYASVLLDEPEPARAPDGTRAGPWRILHEIGRGGMGVVHLAERADGAFEQRVALKLLHAGLDTGELLERFQHERRMLARLEHPGIARLLDGGATEDGRPYLVMEHVEGQPLTAWCDARRESVEGRVRLLLAICDAVEHAHRRLVVHRDLKPSNVLVNAGGQVKLLDFGIAKLLSEEPDGARTQDGRRPMTPRYAAPEQIRGEAITTASDTYALGLLLHELLAGGGPYRLTHGTAPELERAILEQEPEAPSRAVARRMEAGDTEIAELAARRSSSPEALCRRLRGDLDAIVLTALRKQPERRYASALALAQDLERHLRGFPVEARAPTFGYRSRRWLSRHRAAAVAALLVLLSLLAGLGGMAWQARAKAREARRAATVERFLLEVFRVSDPSQSRGESVTARELLDRGAHRVEAGLAGDPGMQAAVMTTLADVYLNLGLYEQALPLAQRAEGRARAAGAVGERALAMALRMQGQALVGQGKYDKAEALVRQALLLHRPQAGAGDAELAEELDNLAIVVRARGQAAEAEALVRESLVVRRHVFGEGHVELATSLANLAVMLRERGRLDEAEPLYREVLAIRRRGLGPDHPDVAQSLDNLAVLLRQRGRLDEAEATAREAVALDRKLFGDDNANTVRALNNLAATVQSLARYEEAERLNRDVLAFWQRTQGSAHPNALATQHNLATGLKERGREDEAEQALRELLVAWPRAVGPAHPANGTTRLHLAALLREQGRLDEAEALFAQALELYRAHHGDAHPDVAALRHQIGLLRLDQGRLGEAESELQQALMVREQALGPQHGLSAQTRTALGSVRRAQGQLDEALRLQQTALDDCRRAYPARHPELATAAMELGRSLIAAGQTAAAMERLKEALAVRAERLGDEHWKTAEARLRLAQAELVAGQTEAARADAAAASAVFVRQPGVRGRLADAARHLRAP